MAHVCAPTSRLPESPMVRSVVGFLMSSALVLGLAAEAQVKYTINPHKLSAAEVSALQGKAQRGDARAMTILGIAYADGGTTPRNIALALNLLRRAAKSDDIAQEFLGSMYRTGRGVTADVVQARHW